MLDLVRIRERLARHGMTAIVSEYGIVVKRTNTNEYLSVFCYAEGREINEWIDSIPYRKKQGIVKDKPSPELPPTLAELSAATRKYGFSFHFRHTDAGFVMVHALAQYGGDRSFATEAEFTQWFREKTKLFPKAKRFIVEIEYQSEAECPDHGDVYTALAHAFKGKTVRVENAD